MLEGSTERTVDVNYLQGRDESQLQLKSLLCLLHDETHLVLRVCVCSVSRVVCGLIKTEYLLPFIIFHTMLCSSAIERATSCASHMLKKKNNKKNN